MTAREVSSERLPERCPHCDLNWIYHPPAIVAGTDKVRCIECKTVLVPPVSSERVSEERLTPEQLLEWASDTNNPLFDYDRVPDHLIAGSIALAQELLALRSSVKTEIRIKPLEWERVTESPVFHGDETKRFWKAANPSGGSSWVNVHTEDFEGEASWGGKKYPNSAAAMNAVEDHLRACILSAIEAPAAEGEQIDKTLLHGICDSLRAVIMEYEDMNMFPGSRAIMQGQLDALTSALKGDRP